MTWSDFHSVKDYWYAAIGAFIGSILSILWAMQEFQTQRRQDKVKYVAKLRQCLTFNIDRLNQARDHLQKNVIPNYPFDTAQLNEWLVESSEILDQDLIKAIDWQRYQLDHITAKIMAVSQAIVLIHSIAGLAGPGQQEFREALIRDLSDHVGTVLNELPPLIQRVHAA